MARSFCGSTRRHVRRTVSISFFEKGLSKVSALLSNGNNVKTSTSLQWRQETKRAQLALRFLRFCLIPEQYTYGVGKIRTCKPDIAECLEKQRNVRFADHGGERGIRTLETVSPPTHFPGVRLRPLGHLSEAPRAQRAEPARTIVKTPLGSTEI